MQYQLLHLRCETMKVLTDTTERRKGKTDFPQDSFSFFSPCCVITLFNASFFSKKKKKLKAGNISILVSFFCTFRSLTLFSVFLYELTFQARWHRMGCQIVLNTIL